MLRNRYFACLGAALLSAALATPAFAQGDAKEILSAGPDKLVEILKNADAPIFDKAKACQRLAVVGTRNEVPVLAELLSDETLNLYARTALEGIQDPAVDEALRQAAGKLQGRQLIGVINSLGKRRDTQAIELLKGFLGNDDQAVAAAAAGALGRIGTTESTNILKQALAGDSPIQEAVADACLVGAEGLAAEGKKEEAVALYEAVAKSGAPQHLQIAALQGQFHLQQGEAKDLLIEQIRSEDEARFNLGLAVARKLPGEEVATALTAELEKLPPERQALLLLALADREEPVPSELLLEASKSESDEVREAAIRVLAESGDASAVPMLLEAALGEGEAAQSAKEGLKSISGEEVDAALVERLDGAKPQEQVVLLELVGARRIASARPAVQRAVKASDPALRSAALNALAQLVELEDLDVLIDPALSGNASEAEASRAALQTAALRMSDREGAAGKLAARLRGASTANQVYLLELLAKLGDQKSLGTVAANARSSDPAIKDAATRVLGEWPNADAAPALLNIAKTDREARYQVRALRGYLRIARQLQLSDEERLEMFRTALEVAKRDEEKQLAFDVLTRIPSTETLNVAVSYLDDPTVKNAAADAAVKIAPKVIPTDAKAVVAAMQKVVDANIGGETATKARQLLNQAKGA